MAQVAFSACNYSALVLLSRAGASTLRLLLPALALLLTMSVLLCAFMQDTDVRKASTVSCVVFTAAVLGSFWVPDSGGLEGADKGEEGEEEEKEEEVVGKKKKEG